MCLSSVYPRCEQSCLGSREKADCGRGRGHGEPHTSPRTTCPSPEDAQMKIQIWRFRTCTAKKPWCSSVSHQLHLFSVKPCYSTPLYFRDENRHPGLGFWARSLRKTHQPVLLIPQSVHHLSTCLGCVYLQCSYIFIYTPAQWFERIILLKNN